MIPRLLGDERKFKCAMNDLAKVPLSTELAQSMADQHARFSEGIAEMFRKCKPEAATPAEKQEALKEAQDAAKPLLDQLKEATRRIKAAGITPSKPTAETESTTET